MIEQSWWISLESNVFNLFHTELLQRYPCVIHLRSASSLVAYIACCLIGLLTRVLDRDWHFALGSPCTSQGASTALHALVWTDRA